MPPDDKDISAPLIPGFLLAFIVMMLLSVSGIGPAEAVRWSTDASRICLVLAISAAGIKTSVEDLLKLGWQPMLMFVGETVFIGAFALVPVLALRLG